MAKAGAKVGKLRAVKIYKFVTWDNENDKNSFHYPIKIQNAKKSELNAAFFFLDWLPVVKMIRYKLMSSFPTEVYEIIKKI